MKRVVCLAMALLLALALTACGGGKQKALVGAWKLSDGDGGDYGLALVFHKDGTMSFGGEELLGALAEAGGEDLNEDELAAAMDMLTGFMEIKYKVKSDTVMEVTVSALGGLAKETTQVEYVLDGNTLTFDGSVYEKAN